MQEGERGKGRPAKRVAVLPRRALGQGLRHPDSARTKASAKMACWGREVGGHDIGIDRMTRILKGKGLWSNIHWAPFKGANC